MPFGPAAILPRAAGEAWLEIEACEMGGHVRHVAFLPRLERSEWRVPLSLQEANREARSLQVLLPKILRTRPQARVLLSPRSFDARWSPSTRSCLDT